MHIAYDMPVHVVDVLQAIRIEHHQRKGCTMSESSLNLLLEKITEVPIVAEPGQIVGER